MIDYINSKIEEKNQKNAEIQRTASKELIEQYMNQIKKGLATNEIKTAFNDGKNKVLFNKKVCNVYDFAPNKPIGHEETNIIINIYDENYNALEHKEFFKGDTFESKYLSYEAMAKIKTLINEGLASA